MAHPPTLEFDAALSECIKILRTAKKNNVNLKSHSYYAAKVPSRLADFRKAFLKIQREFPSGTFPSVAFRLKSIEPLVDKLVAIYPAKPSEMLNLLSEINFKYKSELLAEIELSLAEPIDDPSFFPDDLIEERHSVLKQIMWEINSTHKLGCYNSCAAMIRRLTETLIIEGYEKLQLRHIILDNNGNYLGFKELIGKVTSQPEFKLTRETKRVLPDLKFYGDVGAHNRMALVRKTDLERLHNATRIAIEELVRTI